MLLISTKIQKGAKFVGIASIEPCGTEDVYNMEVVGNHNLSIFNGLVVHNCMDEIRYFCNTVLRRRIRDDE